MHWVDELDCAITLVHHHQQSGIRDRMKFLRLYFPRSFHRWILDQLNMMADDV